MAEYDFIQKIREIIEVEKQVYQKLEMVFGNQNTFQRLAVSVLETSSKVNMLREDIPQHFDDAKSSIDNEKKLAIENVLRAIYAIYGADSKLFMQKVRAQNLDNPDYIDRDGIS